MKNKLFKKGIVIGIIFLFVGASVVSGINIQVQEVEKSSRGNTLYVGGTGEGNFTKIQDAIDNASDEDTILIYNKTYYERINVNKKLTIRGLLSEDDDKPTIDGQKRGAIVNIQSNNCHIENIVVKNAGQNFSPTRAGFIISAKYSHIINCNISGRCYTGIYIMPENEADDSRIVGNAIYGNMIQGIYMPYNPMGGSDGIFISGNSIYGVGYSIYLWAGHDNTINENKIWSNSYGVLIRVGGNTDIIENNITNNGQYGIRIEITDYNNYYHNIERNNICYNAGTGISINSAYYVTIHGNTINNNRNSGISVDHVTKSDIEFNTIESNGEQGIVLSGSSSNNYIYHNNFINNLQNAYDKGANNWDNGYPSGGNYWDDYTGTDANGDGIGDTPYDIPGGSNRDKYPLMTAWGIQSNPPNKPTKPSGSTSGKPRIEYTYTTDATDSDGDRIKYIFDWGDGTTTWTDYHASGETVEASHKWTWQGSYEIKVKAKDIFGYESEWSDTLSVTMPRNRAINTPFLNFLENHPNMFPLLRQILGL